MTRTRNYKHATGHLSARQTPLVAGLFAALLVAAGSGCAQSETDKPPAIATAGPHQVAVGAEIAVTASTQNGSDSSYAWSSASAAIATVDGIGTVKGVSIGETIITVTGNRTKAVSKHPVVVTTGDDQAQIPYYDKWLTSAHADGTAVAFTNWDKDGEIPVNCARCHSSQGFQDYIGADGSLVGEVNRPAPIGSVVGCATCHNATADKLSSVTFPSGVTIGDLGGEARCMTCHQGRSSGAAVDAAITKAAVATDDEVSSALNFQNIHYYPAGATLFAGRAKGGYQYPGQVYDVRFRHVDGYDTCVGCHDPHSTKPRYDQCAGCHTGVNDVTGAQAIRTMSSVGRDYDGDGDVVEGIYGELVGLRTKLLSAISTYGAEQDKPICYTPNTYPYWFADSDGAEGCSAVEAQSSKAYGGWTARLLRATYNFQMATKDPGAFAHNAKYIIELLFDSVQDINGVIARKVDMAKAVRTDFGHFNGVSEAARHWDADEHVDATCSTCHGGQAGFRFYLQYGVGQVVAETPNGLECGTCHTNLSDTFAVVPVASVTFPGGVVRREPGNDNLCETCHRGRESKATVDARIAGGKYGFVNVHYLPAGATKLGSAVHVGYEYTAKTYAGPLSHMGGTQCTSCHDPKGSHHTFTIADSWGTHCKTCHADANGDAKLIRLVHRADYDGDGSTTETLAAEIDGLAARVLTAMQATAPPPGLCYGAGAYPYFFKDSDGNRQCSPTESVSANGFAGWTPALMKAAFNYQLSRVERGGWAHNFAYLGQLLYDSVEDLGGPLTGVVRP